MAVNATIPPVPLPFGAADDSCGGGESFALAVLGDSMEPEFAEGEIIIIEPKGLATDGSYVLAFHHGEWIFRRLARNGDHWLLRPVNPSYRGVPIPDLSVVKGGIIRKAKPGRRRASKRYV